MGNPENIKELLKRLEASGAWKDNDNKDWIDSYKTIKDNQEYTITPGVLKTAPNGKLVFEASGTAKRLSSEELRAEIILSVASLHINKLRKGGRFNTEDPLFLAFNKAVFGQDTGPKDADGYAAGKKMLKDAASDVAGYQDAYSRGLMGTPVSRPSAPTRKMKLDIPFDGDTLIDFMKRSKGVKLANHAVDADEIGKADDALSREVTLEKPAPGSKKEKLTIT